MKTIERLLLIWMMASVVEGQSPCSLAKNFWIVNSSGEFIKCRPCPDCPEGLGLNIQCGSSITITRHTKIECVQCKETKTYSDSHGVESCKPCQNCGRRNVLQECTSVQNRKCGRKCPKGYFFDGHITDCRETTPAIISTTTLSIEPTPSIWPQLSSPIGSGSSTAITASMKVLFSIKSATSTSIASAPSIKPQRSSLISFSSAEIPGSAEVPLLVENRSSPSVEFTQGIMPQPSSLYRGIVSTSIPEGVELPILKGNDASASFSEKKETQGRKSKALTLLIILGIRGAIVLIVIFTPPAVLCWMKFRMSKKTRPEHEDSARIPLNPFRVTENSPSCSLLDFKLADFPYDVEDSILQLDSDSSPVQKNWRHIAHRFEISKQDIQLLETESRKPGVSAIRLLIEKLCSFKCTTLKEFVDVLQELERNDVANDIISWFRQKQDRCSEEGKN